MKCNIIVFFSIATQITPPPTLHSCIISTLELNVTERSPFGTALELLDSPPSPSTSRHDTTQSSYVHLGNTRLYRYSSTVSCDFSCASNTQDNAGTFDTLIPLLPSHMSFLALDLPGHGYSSRIPDGMSYQPMNVFYLLNFVMQEYGWRKISLLSHSMGSVLHYAYAAIFPTRVDLLISLDALKPQIFRPEGLVSMMAELTPELLRADLRNQERTEPPSYTYAETVDRLYEGAVNSITREACPFLLQRNLRKSAKFPDRYYFG